MRKPIYILSALAMLFASCGAKKSELDKKKEKLEELKKKQASIASDITSLQSEIVKLDPSAAQTEKAKLVTITPVQPGTFTHFIDLQGKVDATNIAYVTPRNGTGGQVKAVYVKQGDAVHVGQVLLKLDDAIVRQQIQNATTQLTYVKDIYQRRKNLWDQQIGTEIELNNTKNNVDQAQKQLDILNEQLSFTNVTANLNGVADEVTIRVGEIFTGSPAAGHIKIINTGDLKVTANVPENYMQNISQGTAVKISFPDLSKNIDAKITLTGKTIDPGTRSFYIEAKLPADKDLKPNQIALVRIQDYNAGNAVIVPVNTLQTDEKGKFILVAVNENGKMIARKRQVTAGQMYGNDLEIKDGLKAGDVIITDGYQGLYDGQLITTGTKI